VSEILCAADSGISHPALERHYSVQEIAQLWGFSFNTIKNLFKNETGVLSIGSPETRYGRQRITMRIPESVMLKVYRERTNRTSQVVPIAGKRSGTER
jgi:hypothetical protein